MNKKELIKELETLRDIKNYTQIELLNNGYRAGLLDAIDLVNQYFSEQICSPCTSFKISGKQLVCKNCGKSQREISI